MVSKTHARRSIATLFFLHGLCFSSWGSRIPAIQQKLGLSETTLGSVLFTIPIGLLISMPLTGWLVSKIGSQRLLVLAILLYSFTLASLGIASNVVQLVAGLLIFGMASNLVNVAVNTQAVAVEDLYGRSIMASFHGLWSTAGFTGAAIGTAMIGWAVPPFRHFLLVLSIVIVGALLSFRSLVKDPKQVKADVGDEQAKRGFFTLPDRSLLKLGLIAFCSMTCEGAMFDWSGVYFEKVVLAKHAWVGVGYTAFMSTMAGTRFIADRFVSRHGLARVLQVSGTIAAMGFATAVLSPSLVTATIGFLMIGAGVSAIIPLVFGAAGKSTRVSPSHAIAVISTIGFIGFLIGPPLIGWIAGVSSLRVSFSVIALAGVSIPLIAQSL